MKERRQLKHSCGQTAVSILLPDPSSADKVQKKVTDQLFHEPHAMGKERF